jgi:GNAT superfamily N-acetyltransferase
LFEMSAIGKDAINIRRMTRNDLDGVLALLGKVVKGRTTITYRDMIANNPGGPLDMSLVAEAGGQIVGFILARLEFVYIPLWEVCLVQIVGVDPEYQRHRIGVELFNELEKNCRLEDIDAIRALVAQNEDTLQRFIEHMGFSPSNIVNYDKLLKRRESPWEKG